MKPRFQADNDLRSSIQKGVLRREPSVDFRSASTAGLDGIPDPEVLSLCAKEGRILVSHDENSMPRHFREFRASGHLCPGVLIISQGTPIGAAIESIVLIWLVSEAEEWHERLVWLPL